MLGGSLRLHQSFRNRFHRGPDEDRIPVLVMHGDDDQIVLIVAAGPLSASCLKSTSKFIRARTACLPPTPTQSTPICLFFKGTATATAA
jgi:hypothetical protein